MKLQKIEKHGRNIGELFRRAAADMDSEALREGQLEGESIPASVSIEEHKTTARENGDLERFDKGQAAQLSNPQLTLDEMEILRTFDLDTRYGPCVGICRMERWERAKRLKLNPPPEVYDLLLGRTNDPVNQSIWARWG